jgi:hypothetical protein
MEIENKVLDYFAPENGTDEKIITVKYFYFETPARLYVARLRQQGIQSFISNANTITAFPLGDAGIGLHIRERDSERALSVIEELDENSKQRSQHFNFRDADHEDIAFEKAVYDQEHKKDLTLILFLFLLSMILIRAFMRSSGLLIWADQF